MQAAVQALGEQPRRVFLTIGGLRLAAFLAAPHHHYIVRTIDPPDVIDSLPSHRLILARGACLLEDEVALMRDEHIQVLVTKNSGGAASEAKISAARSLGIEVVMVERGAPGDVETFETLDAVLDWIDRHRPTP
ncbi:precorrin-6A reductase [mine drainage metagenome]|uniref:Precorrin-6A reductase n=1 Tax=mine drainage metagenome TaxID=410659 RepID=A0A1J5NZ31_9ZZZZ